MKILFSIWVCFLLFSCNQGNKPSPYDKLKEYQGHYEYHDKLTLEIAVSPRDSSSVYALLMGARYQLRYISPDTFENAAHQKVVFYRDVTGKITGYKEGGNPELLKVISHNVHFPAEMWYPRMHMEGKTYTYKQPTALNDGITTGNLAETPLNKKLYEDMVNAVIREEYQDIHSILILYKGKLVAEEYFYEFNVDKPHPMRSGTKSFISMLAGIAIDNHILKGVDEKVYPFFGSAKDFANYSTDKEQITLRHLLTQTSGWECNDWDGNSAGNESKMAYQSDWIKFILDLPMRYKPGEHPQYCSGGVITLGRIIEKASKQDLKIFADAYLFKKLGITNYQWHFKPDSSSAETFCQISLRPRDIAKFMLLVDNQGKWNNEQVVSSDWVNQATSTHVTLDNTEYGYLWWKPYLNVGGKRFDALLVTGNGGQKAYIWKDIDLITIFNGGNYNKDSRVTELLSKYILPAFVKDKKYEQLKAESSKLKGTAGKVKKTQG